MYCLSLSSIGGTYAQNTRAAPNACPWVTREGQAREGRGGGRGGGRGAGRCAGLCLRGPGDARPPRHATTAAAAVAAVFAQLATR